MICGTRGVVAVSPYVPSYDELERTNFIYRWAGRPDPLYFLLQDDIEPLPYASVVKMIESGKLLAVPSGVVLQSLL